MTRFKCGGLALGLSWAHVMGDPLSLSHVFKLWSKIFAGEISPKTSNEETRFPNRNSSSGKEPLSIKRVDPVGDLWVTPNKEKMTTFSFNLVLHDITKLHSPAKGDEFETLSAIIWKCISKARGGSEPATITIIRPDPSGPSMGNSQMISSVHVDFSVGEANLEDIVRSIGEAKDERFAINEIGESDDFILYGAKLTFVDLSKVDFYEAKVRAASPESVYCNVQGVGDDGAVVVLPAAKQDERVVTVTLSEGEMEKVKWELKKCGLITPLINGQ